MNDGRSNLGGDQNQAGNFSSGSSAIPVGSPATPGTNPINTPANPPAAFPTNTNTPASQPSYEQQFIQSLNPSPTSSKESGDIVLPASSDKKQRQKFLLIISAVVIGILLLVILAVAALNNSRSQTSGNTIATFNSFGNYLISGTDSSNPPTDDSNTIKFYYHQKLYNGPDFDQSYLDQLSQKFSAFYSTLSSASPAYTTATTYNQLLNFLKLGPVSDKFSHDKIVESYLKNGETAASNLIKTTIAELPEDNPYSAEFRTLKQNEFNATLDYLLVLDTYGCIDHSKKSIDEACEYEIRDIMIFNPELFDYDNISQGKPGISVDNTTAGTNEDTNNPEENDGALLEKTYYAPPENSADDPIKKLNSNNSATNNYPGDDIVTLDFDILTPYSVMIISSNLAHNLLNTDFNLLGDQYLTLKNLIEGAN